jgi:hypothetical protein
MLIRLLIGFEGLKLFIGFRSLDYSLHNHPIYSLDYYLRNGSLAYSLINHSICFIALIMIFLSLEYQASFKICITPLHSLFANQIN